MGWLSALLKIGEKVATYIPGRVERLKNELDRLEQERALLYVTKCDDKKSRRLRDIDRRIYDINRLLSNCAED